MSRRFAGKTRFVVVIIACLVFLAGTASPALAADNATLVVYVEADGGDGNFTFVVFPSTIGTFQMTTAGGGAAQMFDIVPGTYNLTQTISPANWTLQEVVCAGRGQFSTNASLNRAFLTFTSSDDVIYCRFTNIAPSVPIPEFPAGSALIMAGLACALAMLFARSKSRPPIRVAALLVLTLLLFVPFAQARASSIRYYQVGTLGDDNLWQLGTDAKDAIFQFGLSGNDNLNVTAAGGDDVVIQNGGNGNDVLTARGGYGNDIIVQEPSYGDNSAYAQGDDGNDSIIQTGRRGNDNMTIYGGAGNDYIYVSSKDGNDTIFVDGGDGDDNVTVIAGPGDDIVTYNVSAGLDTVSIQGGNGFDNLTITAGNQALVLYDVNGSVLFSIGTGGTSITVTAIEQVTVYGPTGNVLYAKTF